MGFTVTVPNGGSDSASFYNFSGANLGQIVGTDLGNGVGSLSFKSNGNPASLTINSNSQVAIANTMYVANSAVFATNVSMPNTFGFKNRIINGGMTINQYNGASSVTPSGSAYVIDRWQLSIGTNLASKFTVGQNLNGVTPPAGFSYYVGLQAASGGYTPVTSDYGQFRQSVEGLNVADLNWGTANAKTITISFWAYASVVGSYSLILQNYTNAYTYATTYTITSANTWTYCTVTVPGPTTGTFATTNTGNFTLIFNIGTGSTQSTSTTNTWFSGNYLNVTGTVQLSATGSSTLYLTGVQFEVGTQATSFDYRPYGTELALCQRYYYLSNPTNALKNGGAWGAMYTTTNAHITGPLPVPMRTAPAFTFGGTSNTFYISNITSTSTGTPVNTSSSNLIIDFEITSLASGSIGYPVQYNGQLSITAEL